MKPVSESIKFAIDTNIVSAFFKGEPDIGARVREAQQVYLPIIVLAELYFGAEKSPDPERNRQQIDRFLPLVEVLQTTAQTARKYGVIKAELEARGERIPDNDIWIAALVMETSDTIGQSRSTLRTHQRTKLSEVVRSSRRRVGVK
jgi:tRNA(fMet)-specific endonuclease VapC